ncbi:hypothetical protein [Alteromonas sp. PRIM-21]|uniref:hypothetical protein n=1 Tax=Alteromonas sp. PRIM-21 TaxID=1454978 RepID=UPI0022B9C401|nr:hypothetical protein [Alteromonas sp. PRIM-21]MCZ8530397.1 hypothetical protein [Alteromonas sp. PRIM-21]
MNKYLREIEIHLSNHFGREAAFQFAMDAKELSDYIYKTFKTNVTGNFGKIIIKLCSKEVLEKWSSPKYIDDEMSGVLIVEIPFEYDNYASASNENKKAIVSRIMQEEVAGLPENSSIDLEKALEYLKNALTETGYKLKN